MKKFKKEDLSKIDPHVVNSHPKLVLNEIFNLTDKIGAKKFLHGAGFQKEHDLLIGCFFAFYCRELQGREWFIQRISDPPDFELTAPTDRAIKEKPFDHAEIEIVEIPEHIKSLSDAIEIIKSRKIDRPYDLGNDTILLIFLNNSQGPNWSYGLGRFFQNSTDKYKEVFAIYLLKVDLQNSFTYEVKGIRPYGYSKVLSLNDELKKELIPHPLLEKFGVKIE